MLSASSVYNRQYWFRLFTTLQREYPLTARLVGMWMFNDLVARYLVLNPPAHHDLQQVAPGFVAFLREILEDQRSPRARKSVARRQRPCGFLGGALMRKLSPRVASLLLWSLGWTCSVGCEVPSAKQGLPSPSAVAFEQSAYPVLLRDCGFPACHGSSERFFQVYGPGRQRLSPETAPYAAATPDELDLTFSRARSMLKGKRGLSDAPLLRKPLAASAGGAGHRGNDAWEQNVYASKSDQGYRLLEAWARSSRDQAAREAP